MEFLVAAGAAVSTTGFLFGVETAKAAYEDNKARDEDSAQDSARDSAPDSARTNYSAREYRSCPGMPPVVYSARDSARTNDQTALYSKQESVPDSARSARTNGSNMTKLSNMTPLYGINEDGAFPRQSPLASSRSCGTLQTGRTDNEPKPLKFQPRRHGSAQESPGRILLLSAYGGSEESRQENLNKGAKETPSEFLLSEWSEAEATALGFQGDPHGKKVKLTRMVSCPSLKSSYERPPSQSPFYPSFFGFR